MSDERDDDFASSLGNVKPLAGRDKLRPRPAPKRVAPSPGSPSAPHFVDESTGGRVEARREDVPRRTLADLRAGRIPHDAELDLHGLRSGEARAALDAALADARAAGARCVLVIHGAGHHSEGKAVLRDALPGFLLEGRHAGELLAFATAPRDLGGPGASLVLLRRAR